MVLEPSLHLAYTYTEKVKSSKRLNCYLTQWPGGQDMFIKRVSWSWKFKKHGGAGWRVVKVFNHETSHSILLMYLVWTNSHPVAHINEVAIKSKVKSEAEEWLYDKCLLFQVMWKPFELLWSSNMQNSGDGIRPFLSIGPK